MSITKAQGLSNREQRSKSQCSWHNSTSSWAHKGQTSKEGSLSRTHLCRTSCQQHHLSHLIIQLFAFTLPSPPPSSSAGPAQRWPQVHWCCPRLSALDVTSVHVLPAPHLLPAESSRMVFAISLGCHLQKFGSSAPWGNNALGPLQTLPLMPPQYDMFHPCSQRQSQH